MAKAKTLYQRTCAGHECDVTFETTRPNKKYHSKKCAKKAENRRLHKETITDRLIAYKGTTACSICKSTAGKWRAAFFWNIEDQDAENLAAALLLCSKCWKHHCSKRLGQDKQMDKYERVADLAILEADPNFIDDQLNGILQGGLSPVHLEDIAEDKSLLKRAPKPKGYSKAYQQKHMTYCAFGSRSGRTDVLTEELAADLRDSRLKHSGHVQCRECKRYMCEVKPDGSLYFEGSTDTLEESLLVEGVSCRFCFRPGKPVWTALTSARSFGNPDPIQAPAAAPTPRYLLIEGRAAIALDDEEAAAA